MTMLNESPNMAHLLLARLIWTLCQICLQNGALENSPCDGCRKDLKILVESNRCGRICARKSRRKGNNCTIESGREGHRIHKGMEESRSTSGSGIIQFLSTPQLSEMLSTWRTNPCSNSARNHLELFAGSCQSARNKEARQKIGLRCPRGQGAANSGGLVAPSKSADSVHDSIIFQKLITHVGYRREAARIL